MMLSETKRIIISRPMRFAVLSTSYGPVVLRLFLCLP
jgi:hypothetical protein